MRFRTSSSPVIGSVMNLMLFVLTILILAPKSLASITSMLDLGIPIYSEMGNEEGSLSEVLMRPLIDSSSIMIKAKNYLQGLEKAPVCSSFAAKRLWQSCSTIRSTLATIRDTDNLKDQCKQLFAARMALCEGVAARATIPKSCQSILAVTGNTNDFQLASSNTVEVCIKALRRDDNYWTSYSNNLQPASTLCDASRLDVDREEMMEAMHQASILWPGIMKDFNTMQQQLKEFADQQISEQERLVDLQKENKEHVVQYHELQLSLMRRQTAEASQGLKMAVASLQSDVFEARGDVHKLHEGMGNFEQSISTLQQTLIQLSTASSAVHGQLTQAYQNDLEVLSTKAHQLQTFMDEIEITDVIKAVNGIALAAQFATIELNSTIEAHLINLHYSLQLGEEAVQTQQRSVALSQELSQSLQDLRQAVPLIDAVSGILDVLAAVFTRQFQAELVALLLLGLLSCILWLSPLRNLYALHLVLLYATIQSLRMLLWLTEAQSYLTWTAITTKTLLNRAVDALLSIQHPVEGPYISAAWPHSCAALSANAASILAALLTVAFLLLIRTAWRCCSGTSARKSLQSSLPVSLPGLKTRHQLPPTRLTIDQQKYYRYRREMTVPPGL